ncbi:histidine kinase [Burkholderiales bacterium JOSHI_001]|nr:histidine kinase [Burkholderiales bacterium JOSHI_001]
MLQRLISIRTAVALLAITFAIGFFTDRHSEHVSRQQAQTRVALEQLLRLAQARGNSVTSAVLDRDELLAASYKSLAQQLASTLDEAKALTAGMSLSGEMATLVAESERLRATETMMLEQVQYGRWDIARKRVSSSEYQLQKKLYEINTDTTVGALQIELGQTQRKTERINALMTALRVAALALLLLVGVRHARRLQHEITQQVQLREQLAQSNLQLEAKVTERTAELHQALELRAQDAARRLAWEQEKRLEATSFLDMLLHELKNPLATIRLAAHTLIAGRAEAAQDKQRVSTIDDAVSNIDDILERTRMVGRLEHGLTVNQPAAHDLAGLLREWIAKRDSATRARLAVVSPPSLPATIDPLIVRTVFDNLIDNALAYSPAGSRVDLQLDGDEGAAARQLRFQVRNAPGTAGVPDPDKVFSKYYRAAGAQARSGAGLGLFLVRSLARLCGGDVQHRCDGQHIVFEATIPC